MPLQCRFYPPEEYNRLNEAGRLLGKSVMETFGPGAMWYCPWYHDPNRADSAERIADALGVIGNGGYKILSEHYWREWASIRPPINVICPSGSWWCVDQRSSSGGAGWSITGNVPNISAAPSIVVPGYHGFLQNGIFTDDLEGRSL